MRDGDRRCLRCSRLKAYDGVILMTFDAFVDDISDVGHRDFLRGFR